MSRTSTYDSNAPSRFSPARGANVWAKAGVVGILASILFAGSAFHPPVKPAMTVVIDPGHGGSDPGNLGTGRYSKVEKDITLAVALKTAAYIKERIPSVQVIMTRMGDTYPTLPERVRLANDNEADLLMSIHCDAFAKSSANGSATFVMGLEKSEASLRVAQKENAVLFEQGGAEALGFDPDDPDTFIALALRQEIYLDRSLHLANLIQTQFRERVGRKDRGVRQADYYVTAFTNMPSVLVELGFLTNPDEEDYLLSTQGQDYMASALFRAFRDYADHWFSLESAVQDSPGHDGNGVHSNAGGDVPSDLPPEPKSDSGQPENTEQAAPPAWFNTLTSGCTKGICFTVQAASSRSGAPLQSEGFDIPHVTSERSRGVHKYRVGSSPSYEDACRMRDTLRLNGFPDAFVVAFEDGTRIPLEDAIRRQRK